MPMFKLPLSGDVSQQISPFTSLFSPMSNPYGLVNITIGQSSEPGVEGDVLTDVASYGKQLGRLGDALLVLLRHFRPEGPLDPEEQKAIDDLNRMLDAVADVKEKHKRPALRPRRPS